MKRQPFHRLSFSFFVIGALIAILFPLQLQAQKLVLRTLSSAPDMVTGDDVLLEADLPSSAAAKDAKITLNGKNVTADFRLTESPGILRGLVAALAPGRNVVEIKLKGISAHLSILNHPITGPVFYGSPQRPFICETAGNKLGLPLDADCSAKKVVTYVYRSTDPRAAGFKAYDPAMPRPQDLAKTTTTQGKTVDYIVRVERGTINRAVYEIAFLHEPGQPLPTPWNGTPGWNGRLIYTFGGGCEAGYRQGLLSTAVSNKNLSQGYATATSSLNVFGNDCDDVISAETMMMVKEYFIKQFGVPVHTIGEGGSGGSMQQHLIAQNYPGLLDGIMPAASFPDVASLAGPVSDCSLLAKAFMNAKQPWTDDQKKAVSGFYSWATCGRWMAPGFAYDPTHTIKPNGRGFVQANPCNPTVPANLVYDPVKNPHGVRCSLYDNEVNVYGRDPNTGFARRPLDNVGVQYGLAAFNAGKITADQFVELNELVGGYDNDGRLIPTRTIADPEALRIAYATGRVNSGGGDLGRIPIIDIRPYLDSGPNIHDEVRSFAMRARLKAANGNTHNQIIITLPGPVGPMPMAFSKMLSPDSVYSIQSKEALRLMDLWLDGIDADTSTASKAVKIARDKPAELVDACFTERGEKIIEPRVYGTAGRCNHLYPPYADPRIVSGGPLAGDVLKCQLKPIGGKDYAHPLNAADLARLKAVFPQGVCDYSKPGIGQHPIAKTWQSY